MSASDAQKILHFLRYRSGGLTTINDLFFDEFADWSGQRVTNALWSAGRQICLVVVKEDSTLGVRGGKGGKGGKNGKGGNGKSSMVVDNNSNNGKSRPPVPPFKQPPVPFKRLRLSEPEGERECCGAQTQHSDDDDVPREMPQSQGGDLPLDELPQSQVPLGSGGELPQSQVEGSGGELPQLPQSQVEGSGGELPQSQVGSQLSDGGEPGDQGSQDMTQFSQAG